MKKKIVEALIITPSLVLQQGLGALLESLPGITHVEAIKELSKAYSWIESHQPKLVLLDMAVSGSDPRLILEKIQSLSSETQRVLLVDQVADLKWVPQYAEAILIKGVSPSAVAAIVTNLLPGEEHNHTGTTD